MKNNKNMVCRVQLMLIAHYKKEQSPVYLNNWGWYEYKKRTVRDVLKIKLHGSPVSLENSIFISLHASSGVWVGKNHQNSQYEAILEIEYFGGGRILTLQNQEIKELLDIFDHAQKICNEENKILSQ